MENNESKKTKSGANQIAGAIIIAGVLIAGAVLLKNNKAVAPAVTDKGVAVTDIKLKPVSADDHILGNPKAKVVIVEYSDSECPFCKVFHNTMKQVLEKYGNDVAWVYRQYPIDQLHKKARKESEASECAWDQGGNDMFWQYMDKVFELTESNDKLDLAQLPKIAENLGLDVIEFNSCLESGKFAKKVQQSIADGSAAGVSGTPSSFILKKGKIVDTLNGAYPFEQVSAKIDATLK